MQPATIYLYLKQHQTLAKLITSFYDIIDKVSNIVQGSVELKQLFGITQDNDKETIKLNPMERFSGILKQLLSNASKMQTKLQKDNDITW